VTSTHKQDKHAYLLGTYGMAQSCNCRVDTIHISQETAIQVDGEYWPAYMYLHTEFVYVRVAVLDRAGYPRCCWFAPNNVNAAEARGAECPTVGDECTLVYGSLDKAQRRKTQSSDDRGR